MNLRRRHQDFPRDSFDSTLYDVVPINGNIDAVRSAVVSRRNSEVVVGYKGDSMNYLEGRIGESDNSGFRLVRTRSGLLYLGVCFSDLTHLFVPKIPNNL